MRNSVPFDYYIIHEAAADPAITGRNIKILKENTFQNTKLTTLTFEIVLQSCTTPNMTIKNWNGREYQLQDTLRALDNNALVQFNIQQDTWTSEFGHPEIRKDMDMVARQMTVDPKLACDKIHKYWVDGNFIMGLCTTLADGMGEIEKNRILTNHPVMKSSRAIGGVDKNGKVLPGYTIRTFDTVETPSHKEAYMTSTPVIVNKFDLPQGQTFNESVTLLNPATDPSFQKFILTEASSKIELLCGTMGLDYSTIKVDNKNITIKRINEAAMTSDTLIIPIKKVITAEYHNLF